MRLNTGDQGYNNGKKYGQKGAICGPNIETMKRKGGPEHLHFGKSEVGSLRLHGSREKLHVIVTLGFAKFENPKLTSGKVKC
jgi:hypothetical protein